MSGGPLRDFVRRNCTQSRKAAPSRQDAHDLGEAPSSNLLARRFSRPPSRPYGCADFSSKGMSRRGSKEAAFFGLGLRGSLESSLRLPKLAQRAEGHEIETDLANLTY